MEILAYFIVIILSSFWLTASAYITAFMSLIMFWVPDNIRIPMVSILGGAIGSIISVLAAKLIFNLLAGQNSFNLWAHLAAVLPLLIPISNDLGKYKEMKQVEDDSDEIIKANFSASTQSMKLFPYGAILGIILSFIIQ